MLRTAGVVCALLLASAGAAADTARLPPHSQIARDLLAELVAIDTTSSAGSTAPAAELIARRLREAGFAAEDLHVVGPETRKQNLVVRLRGSGGGRRPILLLGHLDVVDALREEWSVDPFKLSERDGFYWGRGTADDKGRVALLVANLIRFKRERYLPDRDIILALTADAE